MGVLTPSVTGGAPLVGVVLYQSFNFLDIGHPSGKLHLQLHHGNWRFHTDQNMETLETMKTPVEIRWYCGLSIRYKIQGGEGAKGCLLWFFFSLTYHGVGTSGVGCFTCSLRPPGQLTLHKECSFGSPTMVYQYILLRLKILYVAEIPSSKGDIYLPHQNIPRKVHLRWR